VLAAGAPVNACLRASRAEIAAPRQRRSFDEVVQLSHAMIDDAQARRAMACAERFGEPGHDDPEALFIDQRYAGYTAEDQETWRILYDRQHEHLATRASRIWREGAERIQLVRAAIPRLDEVSARLAPLTGWRSRAVPGYLPARAFFACVARREFPTTIVLRPREALGYLPEPDIFHDVFGHVPLHADPVFAEFLESYGRIALCARDPGELERLTRLFWFTIEFGLIAERDGLRLYGSGLLSSPNEALHALESPGVERRPFDLEEVCETPFEIDHFQPVLYVLESFAELRDAMHAWRKGRRGPR
jgi:phenylalanine-4-hydroxylase